MASIVKRGKSFILSKLFTIMSSSFLGLIEWGGSLPPHLGQKKSKKPFLISCSMVPLVGGCYSVLKVWADWPECE